MRKPTGKELFSFGRLMAALAIGLAFSIGVSSFSAFARDCEGIRGSVLRFHILANSDSAADQELKLAVRDRILELDSRLFEGAQTLSEAKQAAQRQLDLIQKTALDEIRSRGYDYEVSAELTNMYFSTREYEAFTLPAGYYDAVRITIGEGKGHNWWCVLYPPLCLPAAETGRELGDVLTDEELAVVEGKNEYQFRFALVELFEKIKDYFHGTV